MTTKSTIDPVCLVHGKKKSKHLCLYCCLCFKPLTPEECNVRDNGQKEDVCKPCAKKERTQNMIKIRKSTVQREGSCNNCRTPKRKPRIVYVVSFSFVGFAFRLCTYCRERFFEAMRCHTKE